MAWAAEPPRVRSAQRVQSVQSARSSVPSQANSETGSVQGTLYKLNDIFNRRMKLSVVAAILISTVLALLDTAAISLILPLVDLVSGAGEDSDVLRRVSSLLGDPDRERLASILAVAVVSLFVVKDLGSIYYLWWLAGFKSVERVKLQSRMLRHFVNSPYTSISRRSSSDMLRTLNEAVTQVFGTAVYALMNMITNVISIAAIVAALAIAAPLPTMAVLLYFGLAASLYFYVIKPIARRAGLASARAARDGYTTALAALGGIKELSLRDSQEYFVQRFREASLRGAYAGRTAEVLGGLPRFILEILFIIAIGLFFVSGAATGGGSTVGLLSLFVAGGFRVLPAITGLLGSLSAFRFGRSFLDIVHDEVSESRRIEARAEQQGSTLPFTHSIRIEDLSFRYPAGERNVLDSVNLEIPHGSSFAFVGSSGAGKTTLADLILGLHDPTTGRITVDDVDIAGKKRRWQRNVGYVAQDIFLLDASLAENIAFDQDANDIDQEQLSRAISQAQLDDLVAELPQGVNTPLGERGTRLSGGQRQRVGIARALYRRPKLLVLDEATAALDNETEHRITQTVAQLHEEVTVVIIAHRLSTIKHCDQVAFLKAGRVEAVGTFMDLVERSPDFAELVRLASLTVPGAEKPLEVER